MDPVIKYFTGEKNESYLFLGLGILGLAASIYLGFVNGSSFWKGVAIPFTLVSILEILVGTTLIYRSPKDIHRVQQFMNHEPSLIVTEEIPRMKKVMRNFVVYRYIELALLLTGILIFLFADKQTLLNGIGVGLLIQSGMVLLLDYFAEKRGTVYLEFLNFISGG